MNPLTLKDLTHNAYRTLGLTAGATQAEVDSAARAMRLWQAAEHIPPTANDAIFLGPPRRDLQEIESAVARLADPERRVEERVWWFCEAPPMTVALPPTQGRGFFQRHDRALLAALYTMRERTDGESLNHWSLLIQWFQSLGVDGDYHQWLLKIEQEGEFEKQASLQEVIAAQRDMPARIRLALAASTNRAMAAYRQALQNGWDGNGAAAAVRDMGLAVKLLRTGRDSAPENDAAQQPLDEMEDLLVSRYAALEEAIETEWKAMKRPLLEMTCNHAAKEFRVALEPLVQELLLLVQENAERQLRIRQQTAAFLIAVADAYEAFHAEVECRKTLQTALRFSAGTVLEQQLSERLAARRLQIQELHRESMRPERASTGTSSRDNLSGPKAFLLIAAILIITFLLLLFIDSASKPTHVPGAWNRMERQPIDTPPGNYWSKQALDQAMTRSRGEKASPSPTSQPAEEQPEERGPKRRSLPPNAPWDPPWMNHR